MDKQIEQWVNAFKEEIVKQNLIVQDIPLQGDLFRILIKASNDRGSSGVEAYIRKDMEVLTYQSTIVLSSNQLAKFRKLPPSEQDQIRQEFETLAKKQKITRYEMFDDEENLGVILFSEVGLNYRDPAELRIAYNNLCDSSDEIQNYKNTKIPISNH